MSNEEKRNSATQIGTLGGCLIEGDSEQKARERKIRRRALAISVMLQCLVLVALVLTPLLGKTEKLPYTFLWFAKEIRVQTKQLHGVPDIGIRDAMNYTNQWYLSP